MQWLSILQYSYNGIIMSAGIYISGVHTGNKIREVHIALIRLQYLFTQQVEKTYGKYLLTGMDMQDIAHRIGIREDIVPPDHIAYSQRSCFPLKV